MSKYNSVIIGSSLEALVVASYLSQAGQKVLVIEENSKLNLGVLSPSETIHAVFESIYSFIPATDVSLKSIQNLNSILPYFEPLKETLQNKLTFEKGHLEPFVGFGDHPPAAVDLYSCFLPEQKWHLRTDVSQLITKLTNNLEIRFNTVLSEVNIADKKIHSLVLNEKEKIEADTFIYAKNPIDLLDLLPPMALSPKILSKLSKYQSWAAITLTIVSKALCSESQDLFVLYGTQKNPIVSIGQFSTCLNSRSEVLYTSQWMSFLEQDSQDLSEDGVQVLKEMKRQIKRSFPELFTQIIFEKIALVDNVKSHVDLGTKIFGQLPDIENLLLCSHHLVPDAHIFAATLQAAAQTCQILEARLSLKHNLSETSPQIVTDIAAPTESLQDL